MNHELDAITWRDAYDLARMDATRIRRRALVQDQLVPLLRERGPLHWKDAATALGVSKTKLIDAALHYRRTVSLDAGWLYLHPHLGVR